jgi:hypothetical protein
LLYFHVEPRVDARYGDSKTTKIPIAEVHINKNNNIIMEKTLKINVEWVLCGD